MGKVFLICNKNWKIKKICEENLCEKKSFFKVVATTPTFSSFFIFHDQQQKQNEKKLLANEIAITARLKCQQSRARDE
jgi:hypothetical protein